MGLDSGAFMKQWLARLSFSFLIVGAVLLWTGYTALRAPAEDVPAWQITLYFLGAGGCAALFIAGVKQRHQ
jgi:hypothetical protein